MRSIFHTAAIFLSLTPAVSHAQMVLPGAVTSPTPVGQSGAPPALHRPSNNSGNNPGGEAAVDHHFALARPPAVETIIGKPLSLSGARGVVQVEKSGTELRLSRLTLAGDKISQPNQTCEVTMGDAESLALEPMGAPDGVLRYELVSSACPLQFDVLNGALRATSPNGSCAFPQADCRADAAGLWGPPGDSFGEAQVKSIERERTMLENDIRAHFRSLLTKNKKDKAATQAAVKEQAGFSASRAQTCRDYDREDAHGFCALRLTEARDYRLQTRLAADNPGKKDIKVANPTAKPAAHKPAVAKPAPAQQGGQAF